MIRFVGSCFGLSNDFFCEENEEIICLKRKENDKDVEIAVFSTSGANVMEIRNAAEKYLKKTSS